ncbi:MAG: VWA domain-containing protein [Planctomycetota bacterium]|nr:VWA domain-containing protein [Planctomycetota bacterium]
MHRQNVQSFVVAMVVHVVALTVLYLYKIVEPSQLAAFVIETVAAEDRVQEEFEQEMEQTTEVATTINMVSGGAVSQAVGGSSGGAPLKKPMSFTPNNITKESNVNVAMGAVGLPGEGELGMDLGEGNIKGEGAALVEGYGPALGRLTKEIMRLMRKDPVTVVWMFDESGSMKDDQEQIKGKIHKLYEELKLVDKDPTILSARERRKEKSDTTLLTAVTSFGKLYHEQTPKPTSNVEQIIKAIESIPVDETGEEKMCGALTIVLNKFSKMAKSRKVAIVMVSDESGDDSLGLIGPRDMAKALNIPIYIMGRESVFGSLYAYVPWQDPSTKHWHRLPIRRGPETAFPEGLQWDGFRRRFDAHMSGFGPYSQVKLARDSGGIFFQLPHEEEKLVNFDNKKYEHLALKEYVPDMRDPNIYMQDAQNSNFRKAIQEVIMLLNPHEKKGLEIPENDHFDTNLAAAGRTITQRVNQIATIIVVLDRCQQYLDSVRPLRANEPSRRWRASYDLMYAQLFAYKVRLFEYAIAIGQFSTNLAQHLTDPTHNRWYIRQGGSSLILPTPQQEAGLKVTGDQLKELQKQAVRGFALVQEAHPNTPWAVRAAWEAKRSFGARIGSFKYTPPPPGRPSPKPTPVPKL